MDILFTYGHFYSGGSETLILRLSLYYKKYGQNVTICCMDMIDPMQRLFDINGIDVLFGYSLIDTRFFDIIINFGIEEFVYFHVLKKIKHQKWRNILYVIHPFTLTDWSFGRKLLGYVTLCSRRKYIKKIVNSGCVFFMDEQCIRETTKYYNISFQNDNKRMILPVPYAFSKYDEFLADKISKRNQHFRILTVARADFPFKGYIKGLISAFAEINKVHSNISLTIVSYGREIDKIDMWIKESKNVNIRLIPGMDHKELEDKYKEADLYVGMGTTLLEAVSKGCLVIPVESYTYDCKTWGYFSDQIDWLSTDHHKGSDIDSYLEEVFALSDLEFTKRVKGAWQKAKEYYDIDKVADRLLSVKTLNVGSYNFYEMLIFLNIMKRHLIEHKKIPKCK